jgi:membrane-associated phospholipid phosphatase
MSNRSRIALLGAAAGILLLVVVDLAAFHLGAAQRLDARVFDALGGLRVHPRVTGPASWWASLCNVVPYAYLCLVPLAIALVRRRRDLALLSAAVLLGANVSTEILKALLDQVRPAGLVPAAAPVRGAWPSGHATAAMALALCLVLVVPPRRRGPAAVLGAAFALGVSYAFLTLGWHYPTDVVGGFLVAFTWTCLGVAAHGELRRPRAARRRGATPMDLGAVAIARPALPMSRELAPLAVAMLVTVAAAAALALMRPHTILHYLRVHEELVAALAALATLAVVLAGSLIVVLRRTAA